MVVKAALLIAGSLGAIQNGRPPRDFKSLYKVIETLTRRTECVSISFRSAEIILQSLTPIWREGTKLIPEMVHMYVYLYVNHFTNQFCSCSTNLCETLQKEFRRSKTDIYTFISAEKNFVNLM